MAVRGECDYTFPVEFHYRSYIFIIYLPPTLGKISRVRTSHFPLTRNVILSYLLEKKKKRKKNAHTYDSHHLYLYTIR